MNLFKKLGAVAILAFAVSCGETQENTPAEASQAMIELQHKIDAYAPVTIKADISHLTEKQKQIVKLLSEAGHLADEIFWLQSAHDAKSVYDSLLSSKDEDAKVYADYVKINYGPYDVIYGNERFVGEGPERRPFGAGFYPIDMTKEEFTKYVENHPEQKESLESQYSIVKRDGDKLIAVPYSKAYPQVEKMAALVDSAASLADNESLKTHLTKLAIALRTDNYFEADWSWMDIKNNDIDLVLGPIENYQDEIFNYKTAFEAVVMVKDPQASKELEMFESNINEFQKRLPVDPKYITQLDKTTNILQVVNVAYFGGDCQKGTKTIAASLPNNPDVYTQKGSKKSMYKNMMTAKFEKIVKPIADKILDPALLADVDANAFTSFVTLHEVSHTLGRGKVFGNESLDVRKALEELYSPIEENKADILGMYNFKHLYDMKLVDDAYMKKVVATYLPGLFRSIRFGTVSAHGRANLAQFNYLREKGAIIKMDDGKYTIDMAIFFDKVGEMAREVLTLQAEGNYEGTKKFLEKYSIRTPEIDQMIESLKDIPRDINTTYEY